ncbi:HK97 family phage prohead protease [Rubinisphaera brasiliensis]|uniref:Phage prohead protease, HK97 family n=1 Tax=Rubinisphaera brasiliensis (strain ATCC 49424 / DSM 5305 / JCM 21570 / IAM 15109 / NBRC 103401 / IFAM 1448) TaxID=756272 RepID=F0SQR4_RUBBR|nr:HK97 family phage prohead protease [Rubinisphaera brasiliensis]ADY59094.1 phage prohead protease, HK97 family [Rubinisphaera brasiliensis DSM 5305]
MNKQDYELRAIKSEIRADESGNTIFGMIPFNTLSQNLGGFRERILPSAFQMTLDSGSEVWSYFQHDSDKVLARRSTGTLGLTHTDDGLQVEISPSNTTWSRDTLEVIAHGDSDGFSFGFWVLEDRWIKEDDQIVRELVSVSLGEVSVVYNPAYLQDAQISVRAMNKVRELSGSAGNIEMLQRKQQLAELQTR